VLATVVTGGGIQSTCLNRMTSHMRGRGHLKALRLRGASPVLGAATRDDDVCVAGVLSVACAEAVRRVWEDSDRGAVAVALVWSSIAPVDFNCLGITERTFTGRRAVVALDLAACGARTIA
jgi:hypothetical protein